MSCLPTSGSFRFALLVQTVFLFSVLSALAQHGGSGSHPTPPGQVAPTSRPLDIPAANNPWDQNDLYYGKGSKQASSPIQKGDNCFLPPLNGLAAASVKVSDLQVPASAKREHGDGCLDVAKGKVSGAEKHLRKAVRLWPNYSAAWVVLGQLLEAQQKAEAAMDACSRPLTTESNYLPAYLCLADISARAQDWHKVLSLSTQALALNSTAIAVSYDYNAAANLHLHNLLEAEKSALRAAEIDKSNIDPRVHFLLAQIYEAKGDRISEATQLHEYLKYANDPNDVSMVKKYLSEIENPTSKTQ